MRVRLTGSAFLELSLYISIPPGYVGQYEQILMLSILSKLIFYLPRKLDYINVVAAPPNNEEDISLSCQTIYLSN